MSTQVKPFRLIVRPGDAKLRSSDYWAIVILCAVGSATLIFMVNKGV